MFINVPWRTSARLRFCISSLAIILGSILGCENEERDPVPVLTFQNGNALTCYLGDECYNPVSTSIREGIPLPDGTFLLQSGLISLSSNNPAIAEPDPNGTLIIKKTGECVITAIQAAAPGYNAVGKASFTLTVKPERDPVSELKWYQEKYYDMSQPFYRGIGDSIVNPVISSFPQGGPITYASSDNTIATVSNEGIVKCLKIGHATVTATQSAKPGVNRMASLSFKVIIDRIPVITFSNGSLITCTLGSGISYSNSWTTSVPDGGMITLVHDVSYAFINYQGGIEPRKPGTTMVTVVQEAKHGVNAKGSASYQLIILPQKPVLHFEKDTAYTCSTVNGGCKNEVDNISYDYIQYISYSSSNESIATVNNSGIVTPLQSGTITITATLAPVPDKYQGTTRNYTLKVIDYPMPVMRWSDCAGIGCNITCYLSDPSTCKLTAVSDISNGGQITYSCEDTSIATVNSVTGVITPLKYGNTAIIATQQEKDGVNGPGTVRRLLYVR